MDSSAANDDPFPHVVVYTGNDCFWCDKAKQYLRQRGVPYEERNVEENEAYGPYVVELTGQRHVPVIVVGSRVIVGFRKPELEAELDALLASGRRETMGTLPDRDLIDPRF